MTEQERPFQLEGTYSDHLVQPPDRFRADQPLTEPQFTGSQPRGQQKGRAQRSEFYVSCATVVMQMAQNMSRHRLPVPSGMHLCGTQRAEGISILSPALGGKEGASQCR